MPKLRHRILAGYVLPVVITFVVAWLTHAGLNAIQADANEVSNQYDLAGLNSDLFEAALNTETGFRGYSITGNLSFLEPLEEGRRDFKQAMSMLERRITEQDRLRRLEDLGRLMSDLERFQDTVIDMRKAGGGAAEAAAAISTGAEKRIMDEIRERIAEIKAYRTDRAREAVERRNASISRVWFNVLAGAALGAALSLLAAVIISQ